MRPSAPLSSVTPGDSRPAIEVIREGLAPPCLEAGRILCRGCPGWSAMFTSLSDSVTGWTIIHCPATGLTLSRRE
jgi:hypothetical protein